jgi:MOSC domain-containing protein YiiM
VVEGILRGIYLASRRKEPLVAVTEVRAVPGQGLEGDRYFHNRGSMSRWPRPERAVSLIEQETLDALATAGLDLSGGRSRRNLVVEGVHLDELRGVTFRIGEVLFRGVSPCQPCGYLETLTAPGVFAALKGRGGLRCEILSEGILRVGDVLRVE